MRSFETLLLLQISSTYSLYHLHVIAINVWMNLTDSFVFSTLLFLFIPEAWDISF